MQVLFDHGQRLFRLDCRFVITAQAPQYLNAQTTRLVVFRIDIGGLLKQLGRALEVLPMKAGPSVIVIGLEQSGVQLQRQFELGLSRIEFLAHQQRQAARGMSLRQPRIEFDGFLAGFVGFLAIPRLRIRVHDEERVAIRIASPGQRKMCIDFDRLSEHLPCIFDVCLAKPLEELTAAEVVLVCTHMLARRRFDRRLCRRRQCFEQRFRDAPGYLVLDGKYVPQLLVETLGPEIKTIGDFHELCGYAQAIVGFAHAAFKNRVDAEFLANLAHVSSTAVVQERRCPRDDFQLLDLA